MRHTIDFKQFSLDLECDWLQFTKKYNWYTFQLALLEFERDVYCGDAHVHIKLLGIGFRVYWAWPTELAKKNRAKWEKSIAKWESSK